MFSNDFAKVIFNIEMQVEFIVQWMNVECSRDWPGFNFLPVLPKTRTSREGLQPCSALDQLPLCHSWTRCSLKEVLLGFKHSMTGQERKFLAVTSFPGGKRLFERVLEKTAAFSGNHICAWARVMFRVWAFNTQIHQSSGDFGSAARRNLGFVYVTHSAHTGVVFFLALFWQ